MLAALPAPPTAGFASPPRDAEDGPWATSFASRVANLRSEGVTYEDSAAFLRALTKSGILRFTDIRDRPDRFFLAHRLLAKHAPEHGPGFWIRFTVQFNLFAGTVVALGGPAHLKQLDAIQDAGQLGCFGLTERLAGVNSGLVVDTTATWDAPTQTFIINSPSEGAAKNWISQGLCAEKAVCVADLTVGKKRCGPHAFLIDMRNNSTLELTPGITVGDMGRKTTGNDLDNAWVRFDSLRVPKSALLNRYGDVINGESILHIFVWLYGQLD
jgi:acyl-CoA oxidase